MSTVSAWKKKSQLQLAKSLKGLGVGRTSEHAASTRPLATRTSILARSQWERLAPASTPVAGCARQDSKPLLQRADAISHLDSLPQPQPDREQLTTCSQPARGRFLFVEHHFTEEPRRHQSPVGAGAQRSLERSSARLGNSPTE